MELIETIVIFSGSFFGLVGFGLTLITMVVSLFKIDEADEYYGVGRLGGERLCLKGLPFSQGRMAEYGMVILFSNTRYVQKRYARELAQIAVNDPPRRLERLLVWLYATWFLCGVMFLLLGGLLMLFPETL
ncbi:hypothetical protein SAMN02745148_00071 [Modicisalibacter ilicicola DSM 19980]|uniref:Uncharacterized protein n=1 Tax=Modicisalibacter ilicicola DSM 19980 TaxID=1121942 RepID=A0A1M4SCY5_9GAMM|nr:hypothetical protein [Halomonas ilicicola]SHE30070.1 hypothetical protein SAMN02745148_00071 [Halomonas ilicicola DSM 19980]